MMGAKVHRSTAVDAFIRDFDVVEIEASSSLEHPITCHRFCPWGEEESASIRFRSISIGKDCTVKGMVSLGAQVGDGAFIEKLSVLSEGAQVPSESYAAGNPAFCKRNAEKGKLSTQHAWWLCGALKITWLAFELYLFFSIMLLAQYLWVPRLPTSWRYSSLLVWVIISRGSAFWPLARALLSSGS